MTPTEIYLNNKNLIHNKALKYHKYAPYIELGEFESCANESFCKCLNSYNPDKASFSTYLNTSLENTLSHFLIYFVMEWSELQDYIIDSHNSPEITFDFPEWIKTLSEKSQQVISIIFNTSMDFIASQKNKITKKSLTDYLRNQMGWKFTDIQHCFNEISLSLARN